MDQFTLSLAIRFLRCQEREGQNLAPGTRLPLKSVIAKTQYSILQIHPPFCTHSETGFFAKTRFL
ncbi:MAG: hypothetical protein GY749_20600 [Desulfobacteraceae bacterium]|nr:hypothetical protein [Desulfobacteraceae bacterium]